MQDDGAWLDGAPGRRLPALTTLAVLLLLMPVARQRQRQLHFELELGRPRPRPEAVHWGLRQDDPTRIRSALDALDRLPPPLVGELLASSPLGAGGPLDGLARPYLDRRGDRAAHFGLARLGVD